MSCVAAGGWRGSRGQERNRFHCRNDTDTNVAVIIDILPSLILADRDEECKIHWSQRVGKMCWVTQFDLDIECFQRHNRCWRGYWENCTPNISKIFSFWGSDPLSDKNNHWHPCLNRAEWDVKLCLHGFCAAEQQEVRQSHRNWICKSQISCLVLMSWKDDKVLFLKDGNVWPQGQCYFMKAMPGPFENIHIFLNGEQKGNKISS